jgi:hypothetical protein
MSEMRRNVLTLRAMVIGGAIWASALGAGSAFAFTETPIQPSSGQQAPLTSTAPATTGQNALQGGIGGKVGTPDLSLADPSAASGKSSEGAEVKIPGIGSIGTLPKLDFGLELLYGANGENHPVPEKPTPSNEDMVIRGTLTHRF